MNKSTIFLCLFLLCSSFLLRANTQYSFLRLNNIDGLVNNQVTCFLKDSKGFIWIGTTAGLSRYDGFDFVNFQHSIGDTTSIADNYIVNLQEDKNGNIWIETRWNYVFYNVEQQKFYTNLDDILKTNNLNDEIEKVYIDESKNIWIKRYKNGCFELYDPVKKTLSMPILTNRKQDKTVISFIQKDNRYCYLYACGYIEVFDATNYQLLNTYDYLVDKVKDKSIKTSLYIDNQGDIWFWGNNKGLYHYQSKNKVWKQYDSESSDSPLSSNIVTNIIQDDKGLIWIGTDHGGISVLNKYSGSIQYLYNQEDNQKSISQNSITALYMDNNGIIWIGTYKNGFCYYHESIHKFPQYKHLLSDKNSLPYDDVNCFAEDKKGNLWIGTNGGGLIYYDRIHKKYKTYKKKRGNKNTLSSNVIVSLDIDEKGVLWIGTFTGGLDKYDGEKFTRYVSDFKEGNALPNNNIWSIIEDENGDLLLGTLGAGIIRFNKKNEHFSVLENKGNVKLISKYISQIYKLKNGNLFIATADGITFYDTKEMRYKNHPVKDLPDPLPVSSKSVNSVFEDSRGLLWIASREGVFVIDPETNFLKKFTAKDGLPEIFCNCILEDEFHSIWISKSEGLSQIVVNQSMPGNKFDFLVYDYSKEDGLQGKEFNTQAAFKTSRNELIFGGPNGYNMFEAKDIKYNRVLPHVVFTDFKIFNESVIPNQKYVGKVVLNKTISDTKQLEIKHALNVFSIKFAALDFFIPGKVCFKYKLEGFDQDWIDADLGTHEVTYTNLNAGVYKFKVIAKNNDGFTNEQPAELTIDILPPFYASTTAYVLYFILLLAIILGFRYNMLRRERIKFSLEQERIQAKRHHEMDEIKLRFLTNISHEFRTPLTLILTPLERLLKEISNDRDVKMLKTIEKNATHLLHLVNQLLDFRKLDLHGLHYYPIHGDIIGFIKDVSANFTESFSKKAIKYHFQSNKESFMFDFDKEKMQKIMMNLLSNALKFTSEGGDVLVSINVEDYTGNYMVHISVKDNGIGIMQEETDKIFMRFYQSENNKKMGLSGSGIGLNLTKEMVQLHNGTIVVKSAPEKGSEFIVSLPVLQNESSHSEEWEKGEYADESSLESNIPQVAENDVQDNKGTYTILLAEDNPDFRDFMKESLKGDYRIEEASDGMIALDLIYKTQPDLIISDVMMPKMDGLELCEKLRNDIRISHIPIILLTARTADEDKIKGLEIGADDYITKPFNFSLLKIRITNLIEQRKKLKLRFEENANLISQPEDHSVQDKDSLLITKIVNLIELNMGDPDFNVDSLVKEFNYGRSVFYKKIKKLTGFTPTKFILITKMKFAAKTLTNTNKSIREISSLIGFNDSDYFCRSFKKHYGTAPSNYRNEKQQLS